MVKEGAGLEQYTRSSVGHEELRLRFWLRTGSAGLLEDKKRCKMCTDDRCVLCNSGEVEDVKHFLVRCEEFSWERQRLLERIGQMEGSQEWLEEYWRAEEEGKLALLLGSSIEGGAGPGAGVDEYVMEEVLKWWQRCVCVCVSVGMGHRRGGRWNCSQGVVMYDRSPDCCLMKEVAAFM